jgi:hypothetical protein
LTLPHGPSRVEFGGVGGQPFDAQSAAPGGDEGGHVAAAATSEMSNRSRSYALRPVPIAAGHRRPAVPSCLAPSRLFASVPPCSVSTSVATTPGVVNKVLAHFWVSQCQLEVAQPTRAFFDVPGIDSRDGEADAHLSWIRSRVVHFTGAQDFGGRSVPVITPLPTSLPSVTSIRSTSSVLSDYILAAATASMSRSSLAWTRSASTP